MNLLEEPWLPVRLADGSRTWITPTALADPALVAFDADRPDFNGALAQFAIGLLQTTAPAETNTEWRGLFRSPPDAATLEQWFAPLRTAFDLDGDGPRFMQDLTLRPDEGAVNDIGALLIETPGEQTLKNNADHFVKRGQADAVCPHCVATALLTLQINAPSGGAGHRTGLRGGGPLTTLVACQPPRSLWHDLWLNVRERGAFLDHSGDRSLTEPHQTFPWLADIATLQKEKGELAPIQVHPAHVFWAMPRRIRLDFEQAQPGICPLCGRESDRLVRQYVTKNYGLNYKGAWDHPLSPYYQDKDEWRAIHPQPGGIGYRYWLGWVLGAATESNKAMRRARVVSHVLASGRGVLEGQLRLWAFGYDMNNNMKARCWYEASLPLYGLNECDVDAQRRVEEAVSQWLAAADEAADALVNAVKNAWFPIGLSKDWSPEKKKKFKADIVAQFWANTEADFYRQLRDLITLARVDGDIDYRAFAQTWLARLQQVTVDLFDTQLVGAGAIERQNPRRAAEAYRQLQRNLDGKKIRMALGLPVADKTRPANTAHREGRMSNDLQKNPRLAAALRGWWSGLDDDRAARAELRRAHDITAVSLTPAYQRAYRRLRDAGWDVEGASPLNDRLAAVIGLLAHVKVDGEQPPAQAMSRDDSGGGRPPVSPLRFQRLLEAPDLDALFVGLRRALPLIEHQISITSLAHDIVYWGDEVKKAWAYAYLWPAKKAD